MGVDLDQLMEEVRKESARSVPEEESVVLTLGKESYRRRMRKIKEERRARENKKLTKTHNNSVAQAKYYRKNRERLNAYRRARGRTPQYVYNKARLRARGYGIKWDFDFDTWIDIWLDAPRVRDPRSGFLVTAWSLKGSNPHINTQMYRRDKDKGWSPDNCFIGIGGNELVDEEERWEP